VCVECVLALFFSNHQRQDHLSLEGIFGDDAVLDMDAVSRNAGQELLALADGLRQRLLILPLPLLLLPIQPLGSVLLHAHTQSHAIGGASLMSVYWSHAAAASSHDNGVNRAWGTPELGECAGGVAPHTGARRTHMQLDLSRAVARRRRQLLEVSIADEFDAR
jgi:hypothetical protein